MNIGWLRPAYAQEVDTPYATVYLDATRADEAGSSEVELRWAAARRQLADAGAPEPLLDAMQLRALEPTGVGGSHGLLLVGAGDRVVFHRTLPHPPARESATWSATPHLMPLLRQEWSAVPYALVLADRQG